jgi:hypothetical protein
MDNIQKELIKAGRKDLAQEYYKKIAIDTSVEKYTGYEKLKSTFNHNGIRISTYQVEQDGNDFDGFEAEINGTLSNGIKFIYNHDQKGDGNILAITKKGTTFFKKDFDLNDIGGGWFEVLQGFLKSILDFNF